MEISVKSWKFKLKIFEIIKYEQYTMDWKSKYY